ncbi:MAG TPA: hypothetical protein VNW47_00635 [Terriglobales bacterium]|jgi:hypothetical protein|nr:hypothetical protein [Terriglobales bacterium]
MELLDRYLQAVQFWLPKDQKQDIIAELSEDLRSQIEEKEAELGRKLAESELEAILQRCGSPLAVASRYLPQRSLIGPTLFPLYRFVLGILVLGAVVPRCLTWIAFLIFDPADQGYLNMGNMLDTVVYFAFFTTLGFAIIEWTGVQLHVLNYWNPRKLRPAKDPNRIPLFNSSFEIGAAVIFNTWFIQVMWPRPMIEIFSIKIMLAPAWQIFFWAFVLLNSLNLALSAANLFRPYWSQSRAAVRLLLDLVGGSVFCWLLKAHLLRGLSVSSLSESKAEVLTSTINSLMGKALPFAVVMLVVIFLIGIFRLQRVWKTDRGGGLIAQAVGRITSSMVTGKS